MKSVKRLARMMALAAVVCIMLTMGVFAAEDGNVWLEASSVDNNTIAEIMVDDTVTNGVITLNSSADDLDYQSIELNDDYVAMYSVNADEDGVVRISWVAPGEVQVQNEDWLMKVNFSGTTDEAIVLSGNVTGGQIVDGKDEEGEEPTAPEGSEPSGTEPGETESTKPADPTKPAEGNKPQTGGNGSTGTGDDSNLVAPIVLAVVCVCGIAAVSVVMLKQKKGGKA